MIRFSADRESRKAIASLVAAACSAIVSRVGVFSFLISNFLLFAACSGSSESIDEPQVPSQGPAVLNIYVYAPGQAVPTRANEGLVDAEKAENAINKLQIWVFTADDHTRVTYFETASLESSAERFELPISSDFAVNPENVDVYVLANVSPLNCGLSLDENTTQSTLESAVLAGDYFGLSDSPVSIVPFEGLPMSGVLRNEPVFGTNPVLKLGTDPTMSYVKLARAVSKVRFVFSCSNDFTSLKINNVVFDNETIPNQEYLFLENAKNPYDYNDNDYYIKTEAGYNNVEAPAEPPSLLSVADVAHCDDPAYYSWERFVNDSPDPTTTEERQARAVAYEELISDGLTVQENETQPRLTESRLYLRESDKKLKGKIYYQVKESADGDYGTEKEAEFEMDDAEFFSRNHTWIVYAYLAWAKMNIVAVHPVPWSTDTKDYNLYNW